MWLVLNARSAYARHALLSDICGQFPLKDLQQDELCAFVRRFATEFSTDFCLLHYMLPTRLYSQFEFVTEHELKRFIPYLPWLTVFGPPYIELFGKARLLSAPAHRVDELNEGHVAIQLTPDILDFRNRTDLAIGVQNRVIKHLGPDAFYSADLGEDYSYRAPRLDPGRFWDNAPPEDLPPLNNPTPL